MAAMTFRESNQVKWVGVRPGHNGIQVLDYNIANNNSVIVYTVPAGKVFLWSWFSLSNYGGVNSTGYLYIYDDVPAIWKTMVRLYNYASINPRWAASTMNPPIELPAGYSVRLTSGVDGFILDCSVHGWVEDA